MRESAVTDTHGLIWYGLSRWKKLGSRARRLFQRADSGQAVILVPTTVLVELSEAARRGTVRLNMGFADWCSMLFSTGGFFPGELTLAVVLQAERLYAIPERSDRLIAATAVALDMPLITRDREIGEVSGVRVVW
jgi:PIN domain nuclease of toxin-antitoxin system